MELYSLGMSASVGVATSQRTEQYSGEDQRPPGRPLPAVSLAGMSVVALTLNPATV